MARATMLPVMGLIAIAFSLMRYGAAFALGGGAPQMRSAILLSEIEAKPLGVRVVGGGGAGCGVGGAGRGKARK